MKPISPEQVMEIFIKIHTMLPATWLELRAHIAVDLTALVVKSGYVPPEEPGNKR